MHDQRNPTTLHISIDDAQVSMIDAFQHEKSLPSREAAVLLLLDIAFEAVTSSGRRFWDKPIVGEADPE